MKTVASAVLFLALMTGNQLRSQGPGLDSGSILFHACQASVRVMDSSEPNSTQSDYCAGYFEGFTDVAQFNGAALCLKDARIGTLIRVYVAYMQKNPKLLDDYKVIGVTYALKDAYPCPEKPKGEALK